MRGVLRGQGRVGMTALAFGIIGLLGACNGETTATGPNTNGTESPINTIVTSGPLNASSNDTLIAFSLATNSVVPRTGDWDILLRRYEIRLNSPATAGASTKNVTAYSLNNAKTLTDAQVLALTVDNTLSAFDAIRASSVPSDGSFGTDRLIENKNGYLNLGGAPSANPSAYWKVKTANGGSALFHATAITLSASFAFTSVTYEVRVQNGTTLGAPVSLTVPLGTAPVSYSIVTNSVVTPNGCNWDIQINPNTFDMITNSACNVATYPGGSSPTFATATSASDAPQYLNYITELTGVIPNSVTDLTAPFRYNLLNTQRLHPSFNIYLIKSGTRVYKLQVINYYSASGASGFPTIRAARIQ